MGPIEAIEQHAKQLDAFRARTSPDARKDAVIETVEKSRARFDTPGLTGTINVAPADFLKQVETQAAQQYDAQLTADAQKLAEEQGEIARTLEQLIGVVTQLPDPLRQEDATATGEHTHAIRRVGLLLERDHVERRLTGKTLMQVAEMYTAADDRLDAVLKYTIENQNRLGWPDVRLAEDPGFRGVERVRNAIAAAQRARLERDHAGLVEAEKKIAALKSSAVMQFLLKDARGTRPRVA